MLHRWEGNATRSFRQQKRRERRQQAWMGEEGVLAVEDGRSFDVGLFAGLQDIGAEARPGFTWISRSAVLVLNEDEFPDLVTQLGWQLKQAAFVWLFRHWY